MIKFLELIFWILGKLIVFLRTFKKNLKRSRIYAYKFYFVVMCLVIFGLIRLIPVLLSTRDLIWQLFALVGIPSLIFSIIGIYFGTFIILILVAKEIENAYKEQNYSNIKTSFWYFFDRKLMPKDIVQSRLAHLVLLYGGYVYDESDLL